MARSTRASPLLRALDTALAEVARHEQGPPGPRRVAARHGLVPQRGIASRSAFGCPISLASLGRRTSFSSMAASQFAPQIGCPAWIRTMTRRVKVACATITPPGSDERPKEDVAIGRVKGGNVAVVS